MGLIWTGGGGGERWWNPDDFFLFIFERESGFFTARLFQEERGVCYERTGGGVEVGMRILALGMSG